ncbi:hypothetical protein LSTR_LSTR008292 [Laodelphax striatellus]|uniref:THAP-type domain-containing protein n=1 Tax=Laodelphax striatellus TaxID=195883 RepID=A0A482XIN7_LAOST|nr:hypothetical protein LSTR_LSTR008292 [Laodelphax striatellus]
MVVSCCVYGCRNRFIRRDSGENVDPENHLSFHRFPKDPDARKQWIAAIKRDFDPSPHTAVCSDHFKSEDFYPRYASGLRKLRENAVPSIVDYPEHLKLKKVRQKKRSRTPSEEGTPFDASLDPKRTKEKFKNDQLKKRKIDPDTTDKAESCCVLGCKASVNDSRIQFFRFPKLKFMRNRWIEAIQRPDFKPHIDSIICSQHFVESNYVNQCDSDTKILKANAIPSIFGSLPSHCLLDIEDEPSSQEPSSFEQLLETIPPASPESVREDSICQLESGGEDFKSESESNDFICQSEHVFDVNELNPKENWGKSHEQVVGKQVGIQAPESSSEDCNSQSQSLLELIKATSKNKKTQTFCKDSSKIIFYRQKIHLLLQQLGRKERKIKKMGEQMAIMKEKIEVYEINDLKIKRLSKQCSSS